MRLELLVCNGAIAAYWSFTSSKVFFSLGSNSSILVQFGARWNVGSVDSRLESDLSELAELDC